MSIAQDLFFGRSVDNDVCSYIVRCHRCWWLLVVVGGCCCLTFAKAVLTEVDSWKIPNKRPNSSSVAGAITFLTIIHYTCTGPFSWGISCISVLDFGPRKKYPLALLRASGSDM